MAAKSLRAHHLGPSMSMISKAGGRSSASRLTMMTSTLCALLIVGASIAWLAVLMIIAAASSNILVSGSDDNYLKVWDRRSLGDSGRFTRPSGVLVGHTEGVTYVAPKGDGRFVCSNGKDQTCKLWDLRQMYSADAFDKLDRLDVCERRVMFGDCR